MDWWVVSTYSIKKKTTGYGSPTLFALNSSVLISRRQCFRSNCVAICPRTSASRWVVSTYSTKRKPLEISTLCRYKSLYLRWQGLFLLSKKLAPNKLRDGGFVSTYSTKNKTTVNGVHPKS